MKRTKRISKRLVLVLALIIGASVIVCSTLLSYFVSIESAATTTPLLNYSTDNSTFYPAEEYTDVWDLSSELNAGGDECIKGIFGY